MLKSRHFFLNLEHKFALNEMVYLFLSSAFKNTIKQDDNRVFSNQLYQAKILRVLAWNHLL